MLLRDDFESSKYWLDHWLSCMFDYIHIYVFPLVEKLFLSNLDTSLTLSRHLAVCQALKLFLIAISWAVSTVGGSIGKVPRPSIASRQLVDWSSLFLSFVELSLDSSSIASFVDAFFPWHLSRHLPRYLSTPLFVENYWGSIYRFCVIRTSFFSICLWLFTSQTLSTLP